MRRAKASHCSDAYATPGQSYTGEQRVAPVVAGSHHDHDVASVSAAGGGPDKVGGTCRNGSCCPLHQCIDALYGDGSLFDATNHLDAVRAHDHASQITTAEAMPASWDMLRWMVPMPSSAARAATVPMILN